jgi:hypothetical protein
MQNLLLHAHALGYDLCMHQFQQSAIPAIYLETLHNRYHFVSGKGKDIFVVLLACVYAD